MKLTSNGHFSLINGNGLVIKSLNKEGELINDDDDLKNGTIMYRAKLDSDGYFRLYIDGISAKIEKSWKIDFWNEFFISIGVLCLAVTLLMFGMFLLILIKKESKIQPAAPTTKSSESTAGPHKKTEVFQTFRYRDVSA
ncbi:hypothetical protein FRX31_009562 [Thalictrum thalictroides]|nr:hypothetical protein FRX31_009562 [Thalictrum thalictroides]